MNRAVVVYATARNKAAFDSDEHGGNPFASALIRASQPGTPLRMLLRDVRRLTLEATRGKQRPTWTLPAEANAWKLAPDTFELNESRIALVLVVHDYSLAGRAPLNGAALDERRISAMLASQGFSVTQAVGASRSDISAALRGFAKTSARHDAAAIYCTGHGLLGSEDTYLLPGNYPFSQQARESLLLRRAVPIQKLVESCRASKFNLVFFAGCRNLGLSPNRGSGLKFKSHNNIIKSLTKYKVRS